MIMYHSYHLSDSSQDGSECSYGNGYAKFRMPWLHGKSQIMTAEDFKVHIYKNGPMASASNEDIISY